MKEIKVVEQYTINGQKIGDKCANFIVIVYLKNVCWKK